MAIVMVIRSFERLHETRKSSRSRCRRALHVRNPHLPTYHLPTPSPTHKRALHVVPRQASLAMSMRLQHRHLAVEREKRHAAVNHSAVNANFQRQRRVELKPTNLTQLVRCHEWLTLINNDAPNERDVEHPADAIMARVAFPELQHPI